MDKYNFREATRADIDTITEIYNSNSSFLEHHIAHGKIDKYFVIHEIEEMKAHGFVSEIIEDIYEGKAVGVIDYKEDETVYLSLLMLYKAYQGNGAGSMVYQFFEKQMRQQNRKAIRIDVIDDYVGNVVPFWERNGFTAQGKVKLSWGDKNSDALVMLKQIT